MRVSLDGGESLYLQLARSLREQIIDGTLPVGEPVPSGREIHARWGIGRNTYSAAVRELKREGLVAVRPGMGTYVIARPRLTVIDLGPGDQVAARAPDDAERASTGAGFLTPVLVVTRRDGRTEVHSAAVTICRVLCAD